MKWSLILLCLFNQVLMKSQMYHCICDKSKVYQGTYSPQFYVKNTTLFVLPLQPGNAPRINQAFKS